MVQTVNVEDLEEATGAEKPSALERFRVRVGLQIAAAIFALILIVLVLIAIFAWQTFPDFAQLKELQPDGAKAAELYRSEREQWFTQIKDLLQLLVVSLLVPVLSTVIGYIFGRQAEASQ